MDIATTDGPPPVLLVDDDDALRGTTVDILHLHGFSTHAAATGRHALQLAHDLHPSPIVALVDLRLPDMNGLDLTRELRTVNRELQVVILTGNATVETAIRALRDEDCDYLLKPVEPTQLVRTLRTAEGRWRLRRTEEELETTQRVLRATFEASPLPIVTFDCEGRVSLWNPAAERLFGWTQDDMIDIVPPIVPRGAGEQAKALQAAALNGESFVGIEVKRQTRAGATVHVRLSLAPMRDAMGRVTGLLAVYEDITERRRIEEHLRESQRLDAVGRLAGGVAHDFNNLLAVILGEVDIALENTGTPPGTKETLQSIRYAATSGAALTRQLLTFARRQKTELTVFNANHLLMEIDRLLHRLIGDRIALETDFTADLWSVHADRQQLEQVITNLAVNARDAMPEGGTITLRTSNRVIEPEHVPVGHRAGNWVVLEVVDTGTGIPEEVRDRLFEPFFTTKERGKGTGLGLATSYGIVEQFSGFITVDTELNQGSTFRVFMPRVVETPTERPARNTPVSPRGNEVILVVEDQEQLRGVTSRILTRKGYTVHAASTGADALEMIATLDPPPDLLVLDVNLPDGSGVDFARQLASRSPGARVLLVSGAEGHAAVTEREYAFLPKPFGIEALAQAVRSALDQTAS